ncbi:FecR family protein [Oleiharenicola lentus]|uniref:FecR family protein n=1 Tax=Oleiharenicola lentus TaxID=2508720 RepID=UPI003F6792AF
MKILKSVFAVAMVAFLSLGSLTAADAQSAEAVVVKFTGVSTAQLPGKAEPVQVTEGLKLPAGTVIITGTTGEVHVQPFSGAIATIKPNSTVSIDELSVTKNGSGVVTKQNALLNLKSGNVVSTLDPAKKAVNNYGVRTPKGVAAARGTSYAVNVSVNGTTIVATADTVSFTAANGTTYSVQAGMVVVTPANGEPQEPVALASLASAGSEVANVIAAAVQSLADVIQNNLGELSAESATNLASQVAAVAAAALPDQAASFTAQIVTALASANSSTSGNADATAIAVAAVTAAAAQAAPAQAADIAAAAVTAAPQQAAIITAAAEQAVPSANTAIAEAVSRVTGQSVQQVQDAAAQASSQASRAVSAANTALQNVVTPASQQTPGTENNNGGSNDAAEVSVS